MTPYIFTQSIVANKWVLDIGCGFGHGAWLMANRGAKRLVALDMDKIRVHQTLSLCNDSQGVAGVVMDGEVLGFLDQSLDVVTCFEVIEHVRKPEWLLRELRRVLKQNGVLLLSTPNRAVRLFPLQSPWNSEHLREYNLKAFEKALNLHFPAAEIMGVYAESQCYRFYRRMWGQTPLKAYLGWTLRAVRLFVPASVKSWVRASRSTTAVPGNGVDVDMPVPNPEPSQWPFYLKKIGGAECLNFFAVCGFEREAVERTLGLLQGPRS